MTPCVKGHVTSEMSCSSLRSRSGGVPVGAALETLPSLIGSRCGLRCMVTKAATATIYVTGLWMWGGVAWSSQAATLIDRWELLMASLGLGVDVEHRSPELFFIVFPLLGGLVCCRRTVTFSLH